MGFIRALSALVIFPALMMCSCRSAQRGMDAEASDIRNAVGKSSPISLESWASETITLPPGFAPDMPTGVEELRFAPGWRDPNNENFWSYAFVMRIDESAPDAARIGELLETYYTGLMSAFGVGRDSDVRSDPVRVEVMGAGSDRYEATMHLIDGFATFNPIDLRLLVETAADAPEHSIVRIKISHQPEGHEIWRSLDAALESIRSPGEELQSKDQ